jgi:hypothetical protein
MVKAINIEGEAKCEGLLKILPSIPNIPLNNEQINIQSNGFPPEFLQLFTDQQTSINSTIKYEARLIGTQPLNVKTTKFFFEFLSSYSLRSIGYLIVYQYLTYKIIHIINCKFLMIYIH